MARRIVPKRTKLAHSPIAKTGSPGQRPRMTETTASTKPKKTKRASQAAAGAVESEISLPPAHDWRTTDQDEINRRRLRAREGSFVIRNADARFPVFSNFSVGSGSGLTYTVEIRSVAERQFACTCQDFRKNGLGTCKHVEAVLLHRKRASNASSRGPLRTVRRG
ncbi:MAG: SWIM zinc finger family protein [Verrucomicrobia bacterium]|nr:SWIM zinc finger family protein [Verrucomicrobiota bacterium]